MAAPMLELRNVNKYYKSIHAVKDVTFEVQEGEFVSLLGPSGCGKTTTLRMIAGFEEVNEGIIYLANKDVTYEPPYRRNSGMVFQNYALFPHMTVEQNIAFGLRMRKEEKTNISKRVQKALDLIQMDSYGNRYPRELSGGQQQRVALARALAIEPAILLLDEPLSNLDAKLREEMRVEIKQIQKKIGITSIFVTHDQEEALTMSDRILVMNEGRVVEDGKPFEIYTQPYNSFTGGFIGNSNVFKGIIEGTENSNYVMRTENNLVVKGCSKLSLDKGKQVVLLVRQERMQVNTERSSISVDSNIFPAELKLVSFLGPLFEYICDLGGQEIRIRKTNEGKVVDLSLGQTVYIHWEPEDCIIIKQ